MDCLSCAIALQHGVKAPPCIEKGYQFCPMIRHKRWGKEVLAVLGAVGLGVGYYVVAAWAYGATSYTKEPAPVSSYYDGGYDQVPLTAVVDK